MIIISRKLLIACELAMIFLVLSPCIVNSASAYTAKPNWLKVGTYVKYTTNEAGYAYICNGSNPRGFDTLSFWNATFGWNCLDINESVAKLVFSIEYVGNWSNGVSLNNASAQLSGIVYVNLNNRGVYASNGSLIGTTHFWMPSNLVEAEDVVVWDVPPDKIILKAKVNNIWFQTIQSRQDGFQIEGNGTVKGKSINFLLLCDLDTGLMIDGSFEYDSIMVGAGLNALLLNGRIILSDTNIDLNQTDEPFNWAIVLLFALPTAAFVVLFAIFYTRTSKKHKFF